MSRPLPPTPGIEKQAQPLTLYIVQLLLNFLWTPLFFSWHRLDLATFDILGAMGHGA